MKVVQIGIGHDHATAVMGSMLGLPEVFEVIGFALPEDEEGKYPDRMAEWADLGLRQMSVEEALNYPDLDGAVIETEEKNLTKYAIMAAEKGLHIHMDKPGGLDLAEFEKLIHITKTKKLALSLGYMYRFNPVIKDIVRRIDNGEFGEIYSVETHMSCPHPREKRQWLGEFPGGMMFFLGCHLVDIIYRIQGTPEEIIPLNTSIGFEGVTADEYGMAVFKYKNGISFVKSCALEQGGFMRRQIVICGTKGTFEIRPLEAFACDHLKGSENLLYTEYREINNKLGWGDDAEFERCEPYRRYDDMMKNFADMADGKTVPQYDYELEVYKLVLKACGM